MTDTTPNEDTRSTEQETTVPTEGKADRHTIPNERQCWVLQWKPSKEAEWRVASVHLTFDSVEKAEEKLRQKLETAVEDVYTSHGHWSSPTELVGGEHLVRE